MYTLCCFSYISNVLIERLKDLPCDTLTVPDYTQNLIAVLLVGRDKL